MIVSSAAADRDVPSTLEFFGPAVLVAAVLPWLVAMGIAAYRFRSTRTALKHLLRPIGWGAINAVAFTAVVAAAIGIDELLSRTNINEIVHDLISLVLITLPLVGLGVILFLEARTLIATPRTWSTALALTATSAAVLQTVVLGVIAVMVDPTDPGENIGNALLFSAAIVSVFAVWLVFFPLSFVVLGPSIMYQRARANPPAHEAQEAQIPASVPYPPAAESGPAV